MPQYLKASYKNIPFFVSTADKDSGRRNVDHEYPNVDYSDKEDLGLIDYVFQIEGYLIGDNLDRERKLFENVLEDGLDGYLIHPWRSAINCVVANYKAKESNNEYNMIRYSITFKRQKTTKLAPFVVDTRKQIKEVRDLYLNDVKSSFANKYSLLDKLKSQVNKIRDTIEKCFDIVQKARQVASDTAIVRRSLENVRGKIIELSLSAEALCDAFNDILLLGTELFTGEFFKIEGKQQLNEQRSIIASTKTLALSSEDAESKEVANALYYTALAAFSTLIGETDFDTESEAKEALKFLLTEFNEMSEEDISDNLFLALRNLRQAVYFDLDQRYFSLPSLLTMKLSQQETSLTLCYAVNGNIDYEETIVNGNDIEHPLFIPASVNLKVKTG